MCGGSLKPEPSYSPISSTPSARCGGAETGAATGSSSPSSSLRSCLRSTFHDFPVARDQLVRQHVQHARLLRLQRRGELTDGQVLALERAQVAAHVDAASSHPSR